MAKGKRKKARQLRDHSTALAEISQLRTDLADELQALESDTLLAQRRAELDETAGRLIQRRQNLCAPLLEDVAERTAVADAYLAESKDTFNRINSAWDNAIDMLPARVGRGYSERMAYFYHAMSGDPFSVRMSDDDGGEPTSHQFVEPTEDQDMRRIAEDIRLERNAAGRTLSIELLGRGEPAILSSDVPALGAITPDFTPVSSPRIPDGDLITLDAQDRDIAGSAEATTLAEQWRDRITAARARRDNPLIRPKVLGYQGDPVPSDADWLRYEYAASALNEELCDPRMPALRRMSAAMLASASYWMPVGHAHGFLDSRPLPDEDIADLRLPYSQVFVALADAAILAPSASAPEAHDEIAGRLRWANEAVATRTSLAKDTATSARNATSLATCGYTHARLTIGEAIDALGARIEGVLLLGGDDNALSDDFAWCVAIPSDQGLLGRWIVPASLTNSPYRDQVVNLAAAVAWADWHPAADQDDEDYEIAKRGPATGEGEGRVHVLDVIATHSGSSSGDGTRTVKPHARRGHWRRQWYGVGRTQLKRVRIAPVIVNAGRGDHEARVYELPPLLT